jgi:nicotinamidase-related amidase
MAGNYGYDVYLVEDATAAFELKGVDGKMMDPQTIHDTELAILNGEFSKVRSTQEILNIR